MQEEERYWGKLQPLLLQLDSEPHKYHLLPLPPSLDSPHPQLKPLLVLVAYQVV